MKTKKKPYQGKLAQPIGLPDHWAGERRVHGEGMLRLVTHAIRKKDAQVRAAAEAERLRELFAHFEISPAHPQAWPMLALALARTHVPGFATIRERGAPVVRDAYVKFRLYEYARRKRNALLQRGNRVTQTQVCKALSRDPDFKKELPELAAVKSKSLANLLSEAQQLRRENILHRWNYRATLRRMAELKSEEGWYDTGIISGGDEPFWPSRRRRRFLELLEKVSQKG